MSTVSESTVTSPELVLLEMIIENDQLQAEADKEVRDNARAAQREAMEDELDALEDQADAIRTGAIIQGGLTVAGGATTFAAAIDERATQPATEFSTQPATKFSTPPPLYVAGQTVTGLAQVGSPGTELEFAL